MTNGPMGSDDSPKGSMANPYSDNPKLRGSATDPYAGMAANHAKASAGHKKGMGGTSSGTKPPASKMGGGGGGGKKRG